MFNSEKTWDLKKQFVNSSKVKERPAAVNESTRFNESAMLERTDMVKGPKLTKDALESAVEAPSVRSRFTMTKQPSRAQDDLSVMGSQKPVKETWFS